MFSVSKTVSDETLNCIITIESAGKINARPIGKDGKPASSALGLGQFLDGTWLNTVEHHRPDLIENESRAQVLAMRTDPSFSIEMLARFTEDNQRIVGMKCSGGDLYLAHFLGAGAAQRVYAADPAASVEPMVGPRAVAANHSILAGKTCAEVRTWAARRMAQSSGHAWVAKYYRPDDLPDDAAEPPEVTIDQIPDTQTMPATSVDTPAAAVIPDDPQVVTGKPAPADEDWGQWALKLVKSKMQWAATGMSGISVASLSGAFDHLDWRIVASLTGGVVALFAVIIIERGRKP